MPAKGLNEGFLSKGLNVMAEVFRPTYTVTDPTTGKKSKRRSRTWHIRYYLPNGERPRVKGYRDKKATETKAAELERRGIRVDAGIVDATDLHARTPLAEHAEDFRRHLAAKGNTESYVAKTLFRLTAMLDGCRFVKIADIQSSAIVEYLGTLRTQGTSIKTANDYLATAKGFSRWLWRDKRSVLDALAGQSKFANAETDVRHARRDLAPDELARLLEAARHSPKPIRALAGIDRHFLYLTACSTGLRVSELASMTPESFSLDCETPTARVQAGCTKNRREAVQPLPLDVTNALRGYLESKPAGVQLWPGTWTSHAGAMIRVDLGEARKAWLKSFQDARQRDEAAASDFLTYRDAQGRYCDFHALRHSFITMVGKLGVSPREHQDLARHSSYTLTARYTHSRFYDLAAAVQSLPVLTTATNTGSQELAATGTDGKEPEFLGPNLGLRRDVLGDSERFPETIDTGMSEAKTLGKIRVSASFPGFAADDKKGERGDLNPQPSVPQTDALTS